MRLRQTRRGWEEPHYDLDAFSIRDIDKYLWMLAKERQAKSGTSASAL
jgi:hypothetical protein